MFNILLGILLLLTCGSNAGQVIKTSLKNDKTFAVIRTLAEGTNVTISIESDCLTKAKHGLNFQWIAIQSLCAKEFALWENVNWIEKDEISAGFLLANFNSATCIISNINAGTDFVEWGKLVSCETEKSTLHQKESWNILSQWDKKTLAENGVEIDDKCSYKSPYNSSEDVTTVIPTDGTYIFVLSISQLSHFNGVVGKFDITIEMKSPDGYLSPMEYPLMNFYSWFCIMYIMITIFWSLLSSIRFHYFGTYQIIISLLILLSTIETTLYYCDLTAQNTYGYAVVLISKLACILTCLKHTILYIAILMLSTGYGIVKPCQRTVLVRIVVICSLYAIIALVQGFMKQETDIHTVSRKNNDLFFATIPILVIEIVIAIWCFMALHYTKMIVKKLRDNPKIQMYHIVLAITIPYFALTVLTRSGWLFILDQPCLQNVTITWKIEAALQLCYLFVIMTLIFLWYPSKKSNNMMFATAAADFSESEKLDYSDRMDLVNSDNDEI